jgi:hypothetical protein
MNSFHLFGTARANIKGSDVLFKFSNQKTPRALVLLITAFLVLGYRASAETFFGSTSATNRLLVNEGEVLVVDRCAFQDDGQSTISLVKNGSIYPMQSGSIGFVRPRNPMALSGPAELIVTNNSFISFSVLKSTNVVTLVLPEKSNSIVETNFVVSVPLGRTVRFFKPMGGNTEYVVGRGKSFIRLNEGILVQENVFQVDGPLEVSLFRGDASATVVSYIWIERETPEAAQLSIGGTQTGAIWLERSSNLTNWAPSSLLYPAETSSKFYRLRIDQ